MKLSAKTVFVLGLLGLTSAWSGEESDNKAVQSCLRSWEKHPFQSNAPKFRVIAAQVKVIGIGKDVEDTQKTSKPELVLIKPAVSVMSKMVLRLMNPNGWYCLKAKTAVLGKSEIQIDCKAKLASSVDGVTVLGSNDDSDGVTVLGSSSVKRVGCKEDSGLKEEGSANSEGT